ncbi:MAG: hypothetical protein LUD73_00230, partial [Lachnospiraceae bacterium]|nr:hypothetical protein [Lachnospiraceae bacterium]
MNVTGLWRKGEKIVYVVLFALLLIFSAYIFYGALDTLTGADALQTVIQGKWIPVFLLCLVLLAAVCLLGFLRFVLPFLEKHFRPAVLVLFLIMIALQILTVFFLRTALRHDHLKVFDTAIELLENDTINDTY